MLFKNEDVILLREKLRKHAFDQEKKWDLKNMLMTKKTVRNHDLDHAIDQEKDQVVICM